MKLRKWTCRALCLILVFSSVATAFAAGDSQAGTHWAASVLQKWQDNGWIHGYPDGSLKPDAPVKRAEFAAFINRAFQLKEEKTGVSFVDLPASHWASHEIAIAVEAGYLKGNDQNKVNPDSRTTRQEAAVMIAALLKLPAPTVVDLSAWSDASSIAEWSKSSIAAVAAAGIMKGDANGKFRPKAFITRAETVVALDAALGLAQSTKTFDKPGEYGSATSTPETIVGNAAITSEGVILRNMVITGNLLLGQEIKDGDVTLDHVTVKGTTTVRGGGEHSIHVTDSVLVRIIMDKTGGKVRIVASGSTSVQEVVMQSSAVIEENSLTGTGFADVELSKLLPKDATVDLIGTFDDISVASVSIKISIPKGSVGNVTVAEGASDNTIDVGNDAKILKLVLDAVIKVTGGGSIEKATVNEGAQGSSFEKKPTEVGGSGKDKIDVTAPFVPIFAGGGGGGGGGIDNGNSGGSTCTQCDNAFLSVATAGGYVWEKRNDQYVRVGTGFDKSHFRYSVKTQRDLVPTTIPIVLTAEEPEAEISYQVTYGKSPASTAPKGIQKGTAHFDVALKPLEDIDIDVFVMSPEGQGQYYHFGFYYQRTVQEEFRIVGFPFYDDTGHYATSYALTADLLSFEPDDIAEVYRNPSDSTPKWMLTVNSGHAFQSLPGYNPSSLEDSVLYIKIKRGGSTISEGEYRYDYEPLNLITDSSGVNIRPLNRNELSTASEETPSISYGYEISIDRNALSPLLKNAKFIEFNETPTRGNFPVPYTAVKEVVKQNTPLNSPMDISFLGSSFRNYGYGASVVYDSYVYLYFYDENRNPIGYTATLIKYDEEHVREGVTAMKNTSPILNSSDSEAPVVSVNSSIVAVGHFLTIRSSENGVAYLVPPGTNLSRMAMQQKVQSREGVATVVMADTSKDMFIGDLALGIWNLYVMDVNGNLSAPIAIRIADRASLPLGLYDTNPIFQNYNTGVFLQFTAIIENNQFGYEALKASVSYSSDGGQHFQPLGISDSVSIIGNLLYISFSQPYTGTTNIIKVASGAVKNAATQEVLETDVESPLFREGPVLSAAQGGAVSVSNVGDTIEFMVDRPATAYLVPFGTQMILDILEQKVQEGNGKKIEISQAMVNQPVSMPTNGLTPGLYWLLAYGGSIVMVELALTPNLEYSQVVIHNNLDAQDEVVVNQLTEGDIINIELPLSNFPGLPVRASGVVQPGQTSITLSGLNMEESGGVLYVTRTSVGRAESHRLNVYYDRAVPQS